MSGVIFAALLLCLAMTGSAFAQGFGKITGTVSDPKGALVVNASVAVTNLETGVVKKVTTSSGGLYEVTELVPGPYVVQVEKQGFATENLTDVTVNADATATVDAHLTVGRSDMSVTVFAQGTDLDKTTGAVSVTMGKDLLEYLPYTERSSLSAVMLAPEVTGNPMTPEGVDSENAGIFIGTVSPGATIGIGGAFGGRSSIIIDGSDVTQASYPRAGITVSGMLIGQTAVFSSTVPAQYGRTMGGVMAQSTRSGTNQWHGAATWDYADSFLEANAWGSTFPTTIHKNWFGMYLGGPVWIPKVYNGRNRTFFYASFEPARLKTYSFQQAMIPTDAELQGKFANSFAFLDPTIVAKQGVDAAIASPTRVGHIYQQYVNNADGFPVGAKLTTAVPIPNDDVSAQVAKNPLSQYIISTFPTTANPGPYVHYLRPDGLWNAQGYNAQISRAALAIDNRYSIRVDQTISKQDQFFVRFTSAPLETRRVFGLPVTAPSQQVPADNAGSVDIAVNETHVFSSRLVNTLKLMYMRNRQTRIPNPAALDKDYGTQFNLPAAGAGVGFFNTTLGYGLSLGTATLSTQVDENDQIGDDFTFVHGRHVFGMGLDLRLLRSKQADLSGYYGGALTFTGETTLGTTGGNSLAQLDLGLISGYTSTAQLVPGYYSWHYYGGYFQDSFRVLPKLTLSMGLRYEIETPRMEKYNHQGTFMPGGTASLYGAPVQGSFCFSGTCGLGRSLWPTNYGGLEPRIGIIYAPKSTVVVQAGFALMRMPLSGYGIVPSPNFNANSNTISATTGGVLGAGHPVDFITNPLPPPTSAGTFFTNAGAGPYPYVSSNFGIGYVNQSSQVPYSESWNLSTQWQVGRNTVLKAGYNGLQGIHLVGTFGRPANQAPLAGLMNLVATGANLTTSSNNTLGITQDYPANKGAILGENTTQKLLPYQNFFSSNILEGAARYGHSIYHAAYLSVTHQLAYGLSLQGSYTWSKSLDNVGVDAVANNLTGNGGQGSSVQNPYAPQDAQSLSPTDIPQRGVVGFTEAIPIGSGKYFSFKNRFLNSMISGWRVGGVIQGQSGWPSGIVLGGSGWWTVLAPGAKGVGYVNNGSAQPTASNLRPDIDPTQPCYNTQQDFHRSPLTIPYLNVNHFKMPGSMGNPAFGNASRNLGECRSPYVFQLNANGSKAFDLGKGKHLLLGITASNALNHPTYFSTSNNHTVYSAINSAYLTAPASNAPFLQNTSFGLISYQNIQVRYVQLNARFIF